MHHEASTALPKRGTAQGHAPDAAGERPPPAAPPRRRPLLHPPPPAAPAPPSESCCSGGRGPSALGGRRAEGRQAAASGAGGRAAPQRQVGRRGEAAGGRTAAGSALRSAALLTSSFSSSLPPSRFRRFCGRGFVCAQWSGAAAPGRVRPPAPPLPLPQGSLHTPCSTPTRTPYDSGSSIWSPSACLWCRTGSLRFLPMLPCCAPPLREASELPVMFACGGTWFSLACGSACSLCGCAAQPQEDQSGS